MIASRNPRKVCDPERIYTAPSALRHSFAAATRPVGPGYYISRLWRWSIAPGESTLLMPLKGRAKVIRRYAAFSTRSVFTTFEARPFITN